MGETAQQLVATVVMDDRLADHRAEAGHAHGEPTRDLPVVQRQIGASGAAGHEGLSLWRDDRIGFYGSGNIRATAGRHCGEGQIEYAGTRARTRDPRAAGMNRIERAVETIVFNSRWLVVPFLLGLIVGLAAVVYKFVLKLVDFIIQVPTA